MSNTELAKALTGVAETLKQLRDMQIQANYIFQRIEAQMASSGGFIPIADAARKLGCTATTPTGYKSFFDSKNIKIDKCGKFNGFYTSRWPDVLKAVADHDRKDKERARLSIVK